MPDADFSVLSFAHQLNFYILIPIVGMIVLLVARYMRDYQRPAEALASEMAGLIEKIRSIHRHAGASRDDIENDVDRAFEASTLSDVWSEYRRSLRVLEAPGDSTGRLKTILATAPAETFFSKESVVDAPLNADFYRHLPGMLTGVGIIGTFSGLVWGLVQFQPDTSQALQSLPLLIEEVMSAFLGSSLAILAAMFITYKEKSLLSRCYRLVETLNREIDGMYVAGAGEEYLARIVRVLDRDLRQKEETGLDIARAVKLALQEPMAKLTLALEQATETRAATMAQLLENLTQGFMERLTGATGGQIEAVNRSLHQSAETLKDVQGALTRSIGDISGASTSAASRIAERLQDSLTHALALQDRFSSQTLEQQKSFFDRTENALHGLLSKVEMMSGRMTTAVQNAEDHARERSLTVQQTTAGLREGAVIMREAAERFTDAGDSILGVSNMMLQATLDLKETVGAFRQAFTDQQAMQTGFRNQITQLESLIAQNKHEGLESRHFTEELERAVRALSVAERNSVEHLDKMNEILKRSFQDFGDEMAAQVRMLTTESNRQLNTSLNALSGTVDSMVASVGRLRKVG